MRKTLIIMTTVLLFSGCEKRQATEGIDASDSGASMEAKPLENDGETPSNNSLDTILAAQNDETKERYPYRNPKETLEFFAIKPGMHVVEALPGGGWYSKILQAYLGGDGRLIGVDYDFNMWPNFSFVDDEFLQKRKNWSQEWPQKASSWASSKGAAIDAYTFGTLPQDLSVDAIVFIRALHNLSRFEDKGGYLTRALGESFRILKSGGVVGVVQHHALGKSDEWANGSRGYLKKSVLKAQFEAAGFEFVAESDINSNPKDQPGEDDIVWRLPPSLSTSKDDETLKQQYRDIGESNRMTLLFRKP